nr:MAG TPA: hypothetical protein [Bacteriophage sp.]
MQNIKSRHSKKKAAKPAKPLTLRLLNLPNAS